MYLRIVYRDLKSIIKIYNERDANLDSHQTLSRVPSKAPLRARQRLYLVACIQQTAPTIYIHTTRKCEQLTDAF